MIKTYTMLTKPGIILGNVVTTIAGFALASKGHFDLFLFFATLLGLSLVIASAGIFNNYIDRHSDAIMERTKNRPLANGQISTTKALFLASTLGIFGISILALWTNLLTVGIAAFGFFVYLVLYAFFKYRTFYGTLIGSVAGAVPPVVGYCAVSNRLDYGALILFLILVLWQMPHFFAIAMYYFKDYSAASIPVMPVQKGIETTKIHMALYIIAFTIATPMLSFMGYTGNIYFIVAALLGLAWLALCLNGFKIENNILWARKMFVFSLIVILLLCMTMSVDVIHSA